MDVFHALGHTMVITANTEELLDVYSEYYEHVEMILWEDSPKISRDVSVSPAIPYSYICLCRMPFVFSA